ncbi:MAG: T9SS type A sorting domain-containing protein [Bacteroidia bacterium]|nr:T9SS type A sorting domain-containing protein [Bacteroidia bacterium]
MMHKYIGAILLIIAPLFLYGQYKNNTWLLGYDNNWSGAPWNGSKLVFNQSNITITYDERSMCLNGCYSGLSATDNSWFVYTNGSAVCNKNNDTLTNGYDLSPGGNDGYRQGGYPIPGMSLIIPAQNTGSLLYLFHENILSGASGFPPVGQPRALQLYYSLIEPTGGINGTVYFKNQILINDTLEIGNLTACRHANGRDWWLLVKRFNSSIYYTVLSTPDGPIVKYQQSVPGAISVIGGQGSFSPDGSYFATFDNDSQLRVYDFDRCTGILSNYRTKFITNNTAGCLSFSPNSRFLYIAKPDTLWQFDMQAADVLNSQTFIDKYDGYTDSLFGFANRFWFHWPGPDGKIYMSATSSSRVLHVINNPDEPGLACNFQQHSVHFPTYNAFTTPTYVNLNLMQVPGSVCDSLGVGSDELGVMSEELKVLPNPNDGNFSLQFKAQNKSGTVYIYDVNGALIYSEYVSPFTTIKNINLQGVLTSGVYAVRLERGHKKEWAKVIIKDK